MQSKPRGKINSRNIPMKIKIYLSYQSWTNGIFMINVLEELKTKSF